MLVSFDKDAMLKGSSIEVHRLFAAAAEPDQLDNLYKASAEHLIKVLLGSNQLDEAFIPTINSFKQQLISELSPRSHFYTDPLHPLRRLLDVLLQHACYWHAHGSKSQFLQHCQNLIDEVVLRASINSAGVESAFNNFNSWIEGEYKRAKLLELRVCQTETSYFSLMRIECAVLDLINVSLTGKKLPADVIGLITGPLKSELQHSLINHGDTPLFWRSWSEVLSLIGRAFSNNSGPESLHYISLVQEKLQCCLMLESSNTERYQYLIQSLHQVLSQVVTKQPLNYTLFNALTYPEEYRNNKGQLTQQIHSKICSLKIGSWIIYKNDSGRKIRCKLALKHDETGLWLFVDQSGRKAIIKSPVELSTCFEADKVSVLTPRSFGDFFSRLLDTLVVKANQLARKQKQLEQCKLVETDSSAIKKVVSNVEQVPPKVEAYHPKKLQAAKGTIALLNVGASVEIDSSENTIQRCKLSVIIAATGKYIFADKLGRKKAEYQQEQLIQLCLEGRLRIVNNVDSFEDSLVKVIRRSY